MSRIRLLTTEPLPLPGWPATGAGLRAWGLAQGLRGRGHEVILMMPEDAAAKFVAPEGHAAPTRDLPPGIETFTRAGLKEDLRLRDCDALVLQHWGMARDLPELTVPLAVDLAGPHLLERRLWGSPDAEGDLLEKLDCLRRADYLTCSGEVQRRYFLPYLSLAGWDLAAEAVPLPVIPFSLKASERPAPIRGDRFFYGGFFLPWQDPSAALDALLAAMDETGRGELVFVGGAHPHADVSRGRFDALAARLAAHPRVTMHGPMSYEAYAKLLGEGGVALDLMARNAERELAFTTRTVQYLALGVPVIHDNYSELGGIIENAGAGWTFYPDSPAEIARLRELLKGLLTGAVDPGAFAAAAHRLAQGPLDWDATIGPLDAFCRDPKFREGKLGARLKFESRDRLLARTESELADARASLATLMGKRWVRWGLRAFGVRGWLAIPAAVAALVLGVLLIPVFLINDLWGYLFSGPPDEPNP